MRLTRARSGPRWPALDAAPPPLARLHGDTRPRAPGKPLPRSPPALPDHTTPNRFSVCRGSWPGPTPRRTASCGSRWRRRPQRPGC